VWWASWAFFTLVLNWRGAGDRKLAPYALRTSLRTAASASSLSTTLSVRM
jgi:hypothetical protein